MDIRMKVMIMAANIRRKQGMALEEILSMWPKLTESQKDTIRKKIH